MTHAEREKINKRAELMTVKGVLEMAEALHMNGFPEAAQHARYLATQKKMAMQAASMPLEITGERQSRPRVAQDTQPVPILSPAASNAAKHAALWVVVVGGASTFAGLVVWPALVALGSAVAAMMTAMAPILAGVAGVVFCAYLLFSGLFSEKKTVYPQSGGTVYNIYINQGDKVNVNQ